MTLINEECLSDFEETVEGHIPGFEVKFKDQSKLMSFLGMLARPFNPGFLTRYTTTWGKSVYFPTREHYTEDPHKSFRVLAHEFVHLWDGSKHPWTFKLSYVFPQVLVILPLLAYAVLAWPYSWIPLIPLVGYVLSCLIARFSVALFWVIFAVILVGTGVLSWWLTGWWALILAGALLCLAPWPAPWRTKWEIRGYGMNVALAWWMYQAPFQRQASAIAKQFTGPAYYFMWWSSSRIVSSMLGYRVLAKSLDLRNHDPYGIVYDFYHSKG